ncbi:hypothetical protein ACFOU0_12370 [Salinicoccus sesuvii]|uniref:Uncharacterized protein n=1 Tax=Salinicoccus sesuvii TaxID=868281 RepID=A0ABV7NAX9_9STAP
MKWITVFVFGALTTLGILNILTTQQLLGISFVTILLLTVVAPVIAEKLARKQGN